MPIRLQAVLRKSAKTYIIKLMQPQMPYGAPQGQQRQPGPQGYQGQPQGNSQNPYQGPYQGQSQPGYPYPNQQSQPVGPYAGGAGIPQPQGQQQYPNAGNSGQQAMPQYQPPGGYSQGQQHRPAPLPPPPPVQKTPYDFFMQQRHPTNTKGVIPGPKQLGFKGKLIWVGGGALAIMLIIVVISALQPKDTSTQSLITIAQTQQEVARVCDLGSLKATQLANRSFAVTCSSSIQSDQLKLLSYLKAQGASFNVKQLGALANGNTDKQLAAATASSSYDEAFKTISIKQLNSYVSTLEQAIGSGQLSNSAQVLVSEELVNAKILVGDNASK
jgi:hypothetical protein